MANFDDSLWDSLYRDSVSNLEKETGGKEGGPTSGTLNLYEMTCKCGSTEMPYDIIQNCFVCEACGTTTENMLSEAGELNADDVPRGGNAYNTFMPSSSLGTMVRAKFSKIGMMHNWGQVPYKEKAMAEVLRYIDDCCKKNKIPKPVVDSTKILYKKIRDSKYTSGPNEGKFVLFRGSKLKQLIAACLLFGADLEQVPITLKKVGETFEMTEKQVTKGCRRYWKFISDNYIIYKVKQLCATEYINDKAKFSNEIRNKAKVIANNLYKLNISTNHQPSTIAAVSVLMSLGKFTDNERKMVSDEFSISMVTLNQMVREVNPYLCILTDDVKCDFVLTRMRQRQKESMNEDNSNNNNIIIL